jgi:hypothetical protein
VYGNQWVEDEVLDNERRATQRLDSSALRRMHSGATERGDSSSTQWSDWSDQESSSYVRPSGVDGTPLDDCVELPEDRDDYVDIPDSAFDDLEEDRGDYVNITNNRLSYINAVKIDAVNKLNRFKHWSKNVANRNSRGGDNLNELQAGSNPGVLSTETLHATIPPAGEITKTKPVQAKRPSLFKRLVMKANKSYVNQSVIQDLHDRHQQKGPGPSQNTGNDNELQRILNARFKVLKENEESVETPGTDDVDDNALYRLRQQRSINNGTGEND